MGKRKKKERKENYELGLMKSKSGLREGGVWWVGVWGGGGVR